MQKMVLVSGCADQILEHEQRQPAEATRIETARERQVAETAIRHRFAVQVGVFAERPNAERLAQRLSSAYEQTVLVAPVDIRGRLLYLVRIPVQTESEAESLAVRVGDEHKLKPTIVSLP